jgi:hypothetical protein
MEALIPTQEIWAFGPHKTFDFRFTDLSLGAKASLARNPKHKGDQHALRERFSAPPHSIQYLRKELDKWPQLCATLLPWCSV